MDNLLLEVSTGVSNYSVASVPKIVPGWWWWVCAKKMAWWLKHLLCNQKNQNSDPKHPQKRPDVTEYFWNPRAGESETRLSHKLPNQPA